MHYHYLPTHIKCGLEVVLHQRGADTVAAQVEYNAGHLQSPQETVEVLTPAGMTKSPDRQGILIPAATRSK